MTEQPRTFEEASKRGLQAILIAESFTNRFKPLSHEKPKCLFPVANIPLLLFQLELLAMNNVAEVICVSSRDQKVLFAEVDKVIKQSHTVGKVSLLKIRYFKLERANSLCEALREVSQSQEEINDDFVLMNGDIVSNVNFTNAVKMHFDSKQGNKEHQQIITKIFIKIPYNSDLRDPQQEVAILVDSDTRQILDYGQYQSNSQKSYQLNKKHISLKRQTKSYEILTDVVDTEISICSKDLFKHVNDDIAMRQLKEDFIININTSELTDDQVQAFVLPDKFYYGQVLDPRTYQVISRDVIRRRCSPFVVDWPVFDTQCRMQPFNQYLGKLKSRHLKAKIGDNCVIGQDTSIGEETKIVNSIIGKGCKIGKNISIENSIIWDFCELKNDCQISNSLIAEKCTIGSGAKIQDGCILDKEVSVKEGVVLPLGSVVSCLSIDPETKDSFIRLNTSSDEFYNGSFCQLPSDMTLESYQLMGKSCPYKLGVLGSDEKKRDDYDLECDSDDDLFQEEMSDDKFNSVVEDMVRQIQETGYGVDVAVLNLKQIKHAYSKDNITCVNAIFPAFFRYVGSVLMKPAMKLLDKKAVLEERIAYFGEMFTSFVQSQDVQLESIFLTALSCSKIETLGNTFHLIVQLLYQEDILSGFAILKWFNSAANFELEDSDEEYQLEKIDQKVLDKFKSDMSKFIEYLKSEEALETGDQAAVEQEYDEEGEYDAEEY